MPPVVPLTEWPSPSDLREWVGGEDVLSDEAEVLISDLVLEATEDVVSIIDPDKLPVVVGGEPSCPRTLHRAIVMTAARLLIRRDSANGLVSVGEVAVRVAPSDTDIARLLRPWMLDPEA